MSGREHASDSRYKRWEFFSHEGSHCVARQLRLTPNLRIEWFRYTHTYASSRLRYVNHFHVIRDVRSCQM